MKRLLFILCFALAATVISPEPARGQAAQADFIIDQRASRNGAAITPSDSTDLANPSIWIYVGGAGNLRFITVNGDTVTLTAVIVGQPYHVAAKRVLATGTTATNLVEFY